MARILNYAMPPHMIVVEYVEMEFTYAQNNGRTEEEMQPGWSLSGRAREQGVTLSSHQGESTEKVRAEVDGQG